METRICKQCGELKPIAEFRKYYGGRLGNYKTCKMCEKINARAKYLKAKGDLGRTEAEHSELLKIYQLYEAQRMAGLQPPRENAGRHNALSESLDDMLSKYQNMAATSVCTDGAPVPAELQEWLTRELTEEPEYYVDEIYERLSKKYRPLKAIDKATRQPLYDDTYREALAQVLDRFYKYEDSYYDKED